MSLPKERERRVLLWRSEPIEIPYGKPVLVKTDFVPWFWGFCRWTITREEATKNGLIIVEELKRGRWKWRGRNARYRQALCR